MTHILIFKTNIGSQRKLRLVKPILDGRPEINRWSVDRQDVDNVLRIVAEEQVRVCDVIHMVKARGLYCEELTD